MANKLQEYWKKGKKNLEDQVKDFKNKKTSFNTEPIEKALKSFDQDLSGTLEKAAEAFKKNKGADVQKYAARAVLICNDYYKACIKIGNERGTYAAGQLKLLIPKLEILEAKGVTADNPF